MSYLATIAIFGILIPALLFAATSIVGRFGIVPVILGTLGLLALYVVSVTPFGTASGLGFIAIGLIFRFGLIVVRDV